MNNPVVDRIQSQIKRASPSAQVAFESIQAASISLPISLEELRAILTEEFSNGQPQQVSPTEPLSIHFESIYDFADWYSHNVDMFSSQQRTALDTLTQARAMIDAGCACKRTGREVAAHNYFEQFWLNNGKTDLLQTIAKITGAARVSINHYCVYPPTPKTCGE